MQLRGSVKGDESAYGAWRKLEGGGARKGEDGSDWRGAWCREEGNRTGEKRVASDG